jgi:phosphoribosylanthranilate isomerase
MNLIVKICGLSTPQTLDAALNAGADMVGFVFFAKSPRHISFETARMLAQHMGQRVDKVALTVDADDATIAAIKADLQPQFLQLHGNETAERVAEIRAKFGLPVIKAISLARQEDLAEVPRFEPVADWLLFDAKPPSDTGLPGGNGAVFDWQFLRGLKTVRPWLLAGGLNADNVAGALAATGAPGIDVSSGVESAPGVKDDAQIRAFIANARQIRAA